MLADALKTPIAVLLGGVSAEREISLQSGRAVLAALQSLGYEAVAVDTAEEGWIATLEDNYAHTFIALHGVKGEDGTVQGLLELLGISYTGSGVMASALAMDKLRCKQLWQGINLPTADFSALDEHSDWQSLMQHWGAAIVKPAHEGSSIGMARVDNAAELASAYQAASAYDSVVLAEQWIEGNEYTIAIVDGKAMPAIKLETDHRFYDYDAKYVSNDTRYICPCGLTETKEQALKDLAEKAFSSLGCQGWGRVDVMQDGEGDFYLLEVNTVPGMTSHSLVPMAAKAAGMTFERLVEKILALSLESEST